LFTFSAGGALFFFCNFDGNGRSIVARVWPPRKRDFPKAGAGLRDDPAMASFTVGSVR